MTFAARLKTPEAARRGLRTLARPPFVHFLAATTIALSSGAVSLWSVFRHFEGGITYEFCHYAEIGRNLLEGKGYRTRLVEPSTLAYLDARGIAFGARAPAPVLDRFPLQAALSAAFEYIWGERDSALTLLSMLLLALCAAGTYYVGVLLGFSPWEASAAGLFMAFDPSFQRGFVLWGLPDFGFCLLTLLATAAVARGPERALAPGVPAARPGLGEDGHWFAAGGFGGLAWLARSNFILWLPLFAAAVWTHHGRSAPRPASPSRGAPRGSAVRRAAWFAAGLAAASAPGWLYALRWFGGVNPPTLAWNLAHHTVIDTEPWLSYRLFTVSEVLSAHRPELWRKFCRYLPRYLRDFPALWQMHLVWPAAGLGLWSLAGLGGARRRPEDAAARRWAALTLAMLASQVLAFACLRYEAFGARVQGRYLLWFAPAAFLLAARGASAAGGRLRRGPGRSPWRNHAPGTAVPERAGYRHIALGLFAAANLGFFARFLREPQEAWAHPSHLSVPYWPEIRAVGALAERGLVATNLPGPVAWYARRAAVALPAEPEELLAIARRHEIGALLLSRLEIGEPAETPAWRPLLRDPKALRAFGRASGFDVKADFGTAVLLVRAAPAE